MALCFFVFNIVCTRVCVCVCTHACMCVCECDGTCVEDRGQLVVGSLLLSCGFHQD